MSTKLCAQEADLARIIASRVTVEPAVPTPGFVQETELTEEEVALPSSSTGT